MYRSVTRSLLSVCAVAGAVALAGCGDDNNGDTADAATLTTVTVAPSSYVSKEPVEPTTTINLDDAEPGQRVEQYQEYEIQPLDYPIKIADMYDVPLDELMEFNDWDSESDFPYAGTVIRIPPGGIVPGGGADPSKTTTTPLAGDDYVDNGDDDDDTETTTRDNCAKGTHTVESGEYPLLVAKNYDVTLNALNAANSGTPGYSAFYEGLEIVIPAKSDC